MLRVIIRGGLAAVFLVLACGRAVAADGARHVVLVVWDGMRPDFVTEDNTPMLFQLAREGVTFKNHHPVYPSLTEVNGTALATGVYPEISSIIGNKEYRPTLNLTNSLNTELEAAVRPGDALTGGHYIAVSTLGEILHNNGLNTAVAGTKAVAMFFDRQPREAGTLGTTVFEGRTSPSSLQADLVARLGKFPASGLSKTNRDNWTTDALIGSLWANGVPAFSLLWLAEPDASQHQAGPGSPAALAGIRNSDANLGRVLKELERQGVRENTDIMVVSDHGFSTVNQVTDITSDLQENGFHAVTKYAEGGPRYNDVMVVGNGGSMFYYVIGNSQSQVEKLVHFLQGRSYCGVVMTRNSVEGAFTLTDLKINSGMAPDVVMALRTSPDQSTNGTPGQVALDHDQYMTGQLGLHQGMHGSLSPFDMHNTLIAAGPDFAQGISDFLPTGNVDVTPTVLHLLKVDAKRPMSGRVLAEALAGDGAETVAVQSRRMETSWQGRTFEWRQTLNYSEVNGVVYFDQGVGYQTPQMAGIEHTGRSRERIQTAGNPAP